MSWSKQRCRFDDDEGSPETIDLSNLTDITSTQEDELIELNKRIIIKHPEAKKDWVFFPSSGEPRLIYDKSRWHREPTYRNLAGHRVTPTLINSLLTQNPDGTFKPASYCFEWDQTDESYYKAKAKRGLPVFLARTRENYHLVPETSPFRLMFRCPKMIRGVNTCNGTLGADQTALGSGENSNAPDNGSSRFLLESKRDDISIYINPSNNQARFFCPRCYEYHPLPKELRRALESARLLPPRERKYKNRSEDLDHILELVRETPGITFKEIDARLDFPKGTTKRLCEKLKAAKKITVRGSRSNKVYLKKRGTKTDLP